MRGHGKGEINGEIDKITRDDYKVCFGGLLDSQEAATSTYYVRVYFL